MLALDPALLVEREEFYADVNALVTRVKNALKLPDVSEILVPGERGNRVLQEATQAGEIEIEANLWKELQTVAARAL